MGHTHTQLVMGIICAPSREEAEREERRLEAKREDAKRREQEHYIATRSKKRREWDAAEKERLRKVKERQERQRQAVRRGGGGGGSSRSYSQRDSRGSGRDVDWTPDIGWDHGDYDGGYDSDGSACSA